jgi:Flp pilus assembly protein TadD
MPSKKTAPVASSLVVPESGGRHALLWELLAGVLIVGASCVVYWPSLHGEFLLDDDQLVTESPLVHATDGLYRMWFTIEALDYWPVSNSAFWAEWRLWGKETTGYRVVNLALHIANALLVWAVLRKLQIPGAWLAGLLFAVHPVNVEAVAWIAQLKTVLSATFFLVSIWCYLQFDARGALQSSDGRADSGAGSNAWYVLSLVTFVIALLSKGSVATLPVLLLIVLWWYHGKIKGRDVVRVAPFFLVAIVLAAVNIWFQSHGKTLDIRQASFGQRILAAGAVGWFYLYKAIVPLNLSFVYPLWQVRTADWRWWVPLAATVLVTVALWSGRNSPRWPWIRPVLCAWLFYWAALGPVLGLADVAYMRFSLVADHYQYLALPAMLAVLAAAVWTLAMRLQRPWQTGVQVGIGVVVIALAFLAIRQSALYDDRFTLYTNTLQKNPTCCLAYNNLGVVLMDAGRTSEAIDELNKALQIEPGYSGARYNLAVALGMTGRQREAVEQYRLTLKDEPDNEKALVGLAIALDQAGEQRAAIDVFKTALKLNPNNEKTHMGLAIVLDQIGEKSAAIEELRIALQLNPNDAAIHNKLGIKLSEVGQLPEAIEEIRKAAKLEPSNMDYQGNLKELLNRVQQH